MTIIHDFMKYFAQIKKNRNLESNQERQGWRVRALLIRPSTLRKLKWLEANKRFCCFLAMVFHNTSYDFHTMLLMRFFIRQVLWISLFNV